MYIEMSELTPIKIFNGYQNGELNKITSINYLKSIIEQSDRGRERANALRFLVKIDGDSDSLYEYLEHLMLSDSYSIIRSIASRILIHNYLDKAEKPLRYAIEHENSIRPLIAILESLEKKSDDGSRALIEVFRERLGALFSRLYDKFSARDAIGLDLLTRRVRKDPFWRHYIPERFESEGKHITSLFLEEIDNIGKEIYKIFPTLKKLEIFNCGVGDLSHLTSLKSLIMRGGEYYKLECIKNVKGLETLRNLEHLRLSRNHIRKIENLEKLTNLKKLNLQENFVEKIENLSELQNLKSLNLSCNLITEIENLDSLTNLQELDLSTEDKLFRKNIHEIKNLDALVNLKKLNLSRNNIKELKGLESLTNLEHLNFCENELEEIKGLEHLKNLHYLNITCNKITDLKGLEHLTSLKGLTIVRNKIDRIDGLESLTNLEVLNLDPNLLSQKSVLSKLKNLKWLYCNPWFDFDHWFNYDDYVKLSGNQIDILKKE